ncbi:Clavaminate synthase-like protein [Hysterangium stoloniferum]|nr:Clavaminate synthase-like protein [Hysterangium stoloniferum]
MSSFATLPIIDLDVFLSSGSKEERDEECSKAAHALITFGALILHDSRIEEEDNINFLNLLEDYFAQPDETLRRDERPELGYQVGATLENTEKPKCAIHEPCLDVIARLDPAERPLDISAHNPDPKCRFFWRMSEHPPYETAFPGINSSNIIPEAFHDHWESTLEKWGKSMKEAIEDLAQMTALGLGLDHSAFTDAAKYGPHLLAPTASDLRKYGTKDTILAGFHTDLNFLTIHGRSRYPGLNIWARNTGKRIPVVFPKEGKFLLVQAGKQLEHITGGLIKAGYHEVVVNDATLTTMASRNVAYPDRPQIRISSTFFYHLSSDYDLAPIPQLSEKAKEHDRGLLDLTADQPVYEAMKVGHQVQNELRHIALMA